MNKKFRRALKKSYDIPEPVRKKEFLNSLDKTIKNKPRYKYFLFSEYSARIMAPLLTVLIVISSYGIYNNMQYTNRIDVKSSSISESNEPEQSNSYSDDYENNCSNDDEREIFIDSSELPDTDATLPKNNTPKTTTLKDTNHTVTTSLTPSATKSTSAKSTNPVTKTNPGITTILTKAPPQSADEKNTGYVTNANVIITTIAAEDNITVTSKNIISGEGDADLELPTQFYEPPSDLECVPGDANNSKPAHRPELSPALTTAACTIGDASDPKPVDRPALTTGLMCEAVTETTTTTSVSVSEPSNVYAENNTFDYSKKAKVHFDVYYKGKKEIL